MENTKESPSVKNIPTLIPDVFGHIRAPYYLIVFLPKTFCICYMFVRARVSYAFVCRYLWRPKDSIGVFFYNALA